MTGGLILLLDPEKLLLSRLMTSGVLANLPYPLFHYLALATAILGLYLAGTGILGCWASCAHSFYVLTFVSPIRCSKFERGRLVHRLFFSIF